MAARTLIIGLDGADRRFIDRLIAEGELPHFKALKERSATFEFENDPGQGNVQFWTSAAIGENPAHHGHYFYMQFDPDSYAIISEPHFHLPEVVPFWKQLDGEGYRGAVVDWYEMPVTPLSHGEVIHRWFAEEPLTKTVFHPETLGDIAARYAESDPIAEGYASRPRRSAAERQEFLDRVFSRIDIKGSFFTDHLRDKDYDFYIACLSEAHNVGHYYMDVEDDLHGLHDATLAAAIGKPLRECYRRIDKVLGAVISAAGDEANVFLLGGPGMEEFISANGAIDEMIRRVDVGYEAPLTTADTAKETYHSLIPASLRGHLRPFAQWGRRLLARNAYRDRRFFAVPHNDNAGAVRINLKGREKFGTVAPGNEYQSVIEEIREGVSSFINPATGRSIVKRIVDTSNEFDGPYRDMLPDVFIEWDRTDTHGDFRTLVSELFGEVTVARHARPGDHSPFGFLWAPPSFSETAISRPRDVAAPMLAAIRTAAPRNRQNR